jgi:hypothetical protein
MMAIRPATGVMTIPAQQQKLVIPLTAAMAPLMTLVRAADPAGRRKLWLCGWGGVGWNDV